jgi:hypothetical protein
MTIFLFFLFREICNFIIEIKEDEDIIWEYPGFPSLTISYKNNKEYFFSGSIGLYLICILELIENKYNKLKWITVGGIIIHFCLLICLRTQYYFSIFCGLVSAHYIHILSKKYYFFLNDIYDFDPEETERKNQIKRETELKQVIEMAIKKFNNDQIPKYNKLPFDISGNGDNIEISVDFHNQVDVHENKSVD